MTSILKTYKVTICIVLLLVFCGVSSLPIYAGPITIEEISAEYEIFEMEYDFMKDFKDLDEDVVFENIKIYSEDNRLVRCGSKNNPMIKSLIKRADFLADIGGIEIFRLNK